MDDKKEKRRPESYKNGYEYRRENQWMCLDLDEGYADVISFFCPKTPDPTTFPVDWRKGYNDGKPDKEVTGKVFRPPEYDFTIKCETSKAVSMITDKMYMKKVTKGRRRTPRKEFLEMREWEVYEWVSLYNYLIQAYKEKSKYVLLSAKEWFILQPSISKKEQKKREVGKALRSKLVSY